MPSNLTAEPASHSDVTPAKAGAHPEISQCVPACAGDGSCEASHQTQISRFRGNDAVCERNVVLQTVPSQPPPSPPFTNPPLLSF
jgi:hypothetical protein